MKFFRNLFGGKNKKKDEAEVQKLVEAFTKPKEKAGVEIEISQEQFQKFMELEKKRTPEGKAALAAELALRLQHAIELNDVDLFKDVELDAEIYLKGTDIFWYYQAKDIQKAEPTLSKEALALRVLEWSKKEGARFTTNE